MCFGTKRVEHTHMHAHLVTYAHTRPHTQMHTCTHMPTDINAHTRTCAHNIGQRHTYALCPKQHTSWVYLDLPVASADKFVPLRVSAPGFNPKPASGSGPGSTSGSCFWAHAALWKFPPDSGRAHTHHGAHIYIWKVKHFPLTSL